MNRLLLMLVILLMAGCSSVPDWQTAPIPDETPATHVAEAEAQAEADAQEEQRSEAVAQARDLAKENGMVDVEVNGVVMETVPESLVPSHAEVRRQIRMRMPVNNSLAVYDPFEPFNRMMYDFNARFDEWVFLPAVSGYRAVTPDVVESGVSHFFANLREVKNLVNNLLQLRLVDSGVTLSRFVINSTVGVAGLWDPASRVGLYEKSEDFGQTLGYWGVGPGPYLVLPFFGPSSLRDGGGRVMDIAIESQVDLLRVAGDENRDLKQVGLTLLESLDTRRNIGFRYYQTGSPFEYELVRFAWKELREIEIEK